MKTELCIFSFYKIHPGHGSRLIKSDSKSVFFRDKKCKKYYLQKQKAAKFRWTQIYRKVNKKGVSESKTRKRTRRVQKIQRSVEGTPLDTILKKRNQNPEERKAARDTALVELKKRREAQKAARKERKEKTIQTGGVSQKTISQKGSGNKGR